MTENPLSSGFAGDPFALFRQWLAEAEKAEADDPAAMTLATADAGGRISARVMLLKGVEDGGFVFYTNTLSRKGEQLRENPHAALCFHWKNLRRQVRVEGAAAPVPPAQADAYFKTRPRGSQLGAWASLQSQALDQRTTLDARVKEFEATFEGQDVPRPPHWSGYRVEPVYIEFWQDRKFRLHDRLIFTRDGAGWKQERWYP